MWFLKPKISNEEIDMAWAVFAKHMLGFLLCLKRDEDFRKFMNFKAKFHTNDLIGIMKKYKISYDELKIAYPSECLDMDLARLYRGKINRNQVREWVSDELKKFAEARDAK